MYCTAKDWSLPLEIVVVVTLLSVVAKWTDACSCEQRHPQQQFCLSDFGEYHRFADVLIENNSLKNKTSLHFRSFQIRSLVA